MDKAIDFHVHIFPDSIAQKATDHVGEYTQRSTVGKREREPSIGGRGKRQI